MLFINESDHRISLYTWLVKFYIFFLASTVENVVENVNALINFYFKQLKHGSPVHCFPTTVCRFFRAFGRHEETLHFIYFASFMLNQQNSFSFYFSKAKLLCKQIKIAERLTETDTIEFLNALITDVEHTKLVFCATFCRLRWQFKTIKWRNMENEFLREMTADKNSNEKDFPQGLKTWWIFLNSFLKAENIFHYSFS